MAGVKAKRILIYGVCGSGKTTFAAALSDRLGIPWHSVDDLTWEPGWKEVPVDDQRQRIQAICDQEIWILDTAYGKWIDVPIARVELIIGLDYSRPLTFWRLLKRSVARAVDKRPICNGNQESIRLMLSRDSILLWHVKSFAKKRARIRAWDKQPAGFEIIVFRKPSEASRWFESQVSPPGSLSLT